MHCAKISAQVEFEGQTQSPLCVHPHNVAFGYDVGKISAGCLVSDMFNVASIILK